MTYRPTYPTCIVMTHPPEVDAGARWQDVLAAWYSEEREPLPEAAEKHLDRWLSDESARCELEHKIHVKSRRIDLLRAQWLEADSQALRDQLNDEADMLTLTVQSLEEQLDELHQGGTHHATRPFQPDPLHEAPAPNASGGTTND